MTTWVTGRRLCGLRIAAGWPELYGSIRARPGQCGPGVLPLLCPVYDCLAAVEVGSSCVAARLLSLAPTMSCASGVLAACRCHEAMDDGDFKIVVAHASGRRSWVVVLRCAGVFCGWRREKSLSAGLTPTRCRLRVAPFLPGGRRGNPLSTVLYIPGETLGPSGPGSSVVLTTFPFLKVLLGTERFGMLEAWWPEMEGAAVAVTSPTLDLADRKSVV